MENVAEKQLIDPKALVCVTEYARRMGVTINTVYNRLRKGDIIPVKLGPEGQYIFIDISEYGNFKFGRW